MGQVKYFETPYKTRILLGNVADLHIGVAPKGINSSKLPIKNGINGTFYYSGYDEQKKEKIYYATSLLYVDYNGVKGVQGSWTANHFPNKQSCVIKYKDGSIKMIPVLNISQIQSELPRIEFVIGGAGLYNNGKIIKHEDEGFKGVFADIGRKCNKTLLGINTKTKQSVLVTRENLKNRESMNFITKRKLYDLEDLAKDLVADYGCDAVLQLDGGGSTVQYKDGKRIVGGGRIIHNYLYFD